MTLAHECFSGDMAPADQVTAEPPKLRILEEGDVLSAGEWLAIVDGNQQALAAEEAAEDAKSFRKPPRRPLGRISLFAARVR